MAIGQGIQYLKMTDEAFAQLMNAMRRDQQLRGSIR
jgi:hypothetical protein